MPDLAPNNAAAKEALNASAVSDANSSNQDFEAIQVLLDEWKWRHQHCWKSLQRFGLAGITLAIIPYAKTDLFQSRLGLGILIFPFAAWLLALAAAWLFTAEYTRCRPVETKYYELLGLRYRPVNRHRTSKNHQKSIGRSTISIFIIGATLLAITNAEILIHVAGLNQEINVWIRRGIAVVVFGFSLWLARKMSDWAAQEINKIININLLEDSDQ